MLANAGRAYTFIAIRARFSQIFSCDASHQHWNWEEPRNCVFFLPLSDRHGTSPNLGRDPIPLTMRWEEPGSLNGTGIALLTTLLLSSGPIAADPAVDTGARPADRSDAAADARNGRQATIRPASIILPINPPSRLTTNQSQ